MLAGEPKPVRCLLGREQLLLLGNSHGYPLALSEQPVDLIGHKRCLIASGRIKMQSLHRHHTVAQPVLPAHLIYT